MEKIDLSSFEFLVIGFQEEDSRVQISLVSRDRLGYVLDLSQRKGQKKIRVFEIATGKEITSDCPEFWI